MESLSFFIAKASESDGVKRWTATPTKFAADKERDEVTQEFYEFSAKMIGDGAHPTPALVVSHFDDPRFSQAHEPTPSEFAAGWATKLFIDRKQPKVQGVFENNELGSALYEAVKADMDNNVPHDERIRISMAWRPIKGGLDMTGDVTRHIKGMIRHFAATRVPIIGETELLVEKAGVRKTKYEDAATIIGEALAAKLDDIHNEVAFSEKADLLVKSGGTSSGGTTYELEHTFINEFGTPISNPEFNKADEEDDMPKSNDDKKQSTSKMADCINKKMDAGAERRDAVASCLRDLPAKEKKVSEKLGKLETEKSGHVRYDDPSRLSAYDVSTTSDTTSPEGRRRYRHCINQLKREGFPKDVVVSHCRRSPLGGDIQPHRPVESFSQCMRRAQRNGLDNAIASQFCSQRMRERADLITQSSPDGGIVLIDMALGYSHIDVDTEKAELIEKPALNAPMGDCIKSYMAEDMERDQAIAICLDKKRAKARKESGTEKGDLHAILDAIISDDGMQVVSEGEPVMKSEANGDHTSTHYLVVVDPKNESTWQLPVRTEKGDLSVDMMDAAWAALVHPEGGYYGVYKGPRKQEAIYKLEDLYAGLGLAPPRSKAHLDEMPLEDILTGELLKADNLIDELMGEIINMTKQEEVRSDTEVEEESEDEEKDKEAEVAEDAAAVEEVAEEEASAAPEEPSVSEEESTEAKTAEEVAGPPAAEEADKEEEGAEKQDSGESESAQAEDAPSTDVNAGDVASGEAVKSEAVSGSGLDGLVQELESALSDTSLDRATKVAFANTVFAKMGEQVDAAISQTPPSAEDEAEKFKAEMMGIVTPLADQIATQEAEIARLKAQLDERGDIFQPPTPQQLQYQGVEKAEADDGGAMTADQIAKGTVTYDKPPY